MHHLYNAGLIQVRSRVTCTDLVVSMFRLDRSAAEQYRKICQSEIPGVSEILRMERQITMIEPPSSISTMIIESPVTPPAVNLV